ncbi:PREDICTED: acyl-CoA Delta(11) desaturase [Nicrophorus vespilloides]|uniref:Acyl-CoA Delta(11) desaturase n=1 Tax=Nicrophorus vespilloides TaxID=110193 RepID=A0ABM1MW62_NICVS|nr:PREDICTED: acyl-CoA Delta(11) desaturase [Nicrophorus vespilloides]
MTSETAPTQIPIPEKIKREFDWFKVIVFLHLNALTILGIYLLPNALTRTCLYGLVLVLLGILGVTAGSHRLWAHNSYKATTKLKVFLMLCQTLVGQGSIYNWVLQHRIHHKFNGTSFDPYNYKKGFVYSHFMHFLQKRHEFQDKVESEIDMSDIEEDKVVMFQKKYYWVFYIVVFALLPMNAPAEYWGENILVSCVLIGWVRYYMVLNAAWLVNSAVHIWGLQPGEKFPCDTNMVFFVDKNYWIQYHYLAPWDYLCSEFGKYGTDCTTKFIRACAAIGWASDLKTVDPETVREMAFQSIETKTSVADCFAQVEKVSIEKQYYLKPML